MSSSSSTSPPRSITITASTLDVLRQRIDDVKTTLSSMKSSSTRQLSNLYELLEPIVYHIRNILSGIVGLENSGVIPNVDVNENNINDFFYNTYQQFYPTMDLVNAIDSYKKSGLSSGETFFGKFSILFEVLIIAFIVLYIMYIYRSMYRQDYTFFQYLKEFQPYFTRVMAFFKKKSSKQGGSATQGGLKIKSNRRQKQRGGISIFRTIYSQMGLKYQQIINEIELKTIPEHLKMAVKLLCFVLLYVTSSTTFRIYKAFNWLHYNMLSGKVYLFITCLLCAKQFTDKNSNEISALFAPQDEVELYLQSIQ